jgi:hypothetical protein
MPFARAMSVSGPSLHQHHYGPADRYRDQNCDRANPSGSVFRGLKATLNFGVQQRLDGLLGRAEGDIGRLRHPKRYEA